MLRRRVYLLRHAKTGKYLLDASLKAIDDPNAAKQWGSRLSAKTWAETIELDHEWLPYPHELAPEPEPEPEPPAYRQGIATAVSLIKDLHDEYCGRAETWLNKAGVNGPYNTPMLSITCQWHPWAGIYQQRDNRVIYSLHHAMLYLGSGKLDATSPEADYSISIAHEATHAYQKALCGPGDYKVGHGGDFYAIMRQAMRTPVTVHHHYYPQDLSQQMSKWLQRQIEQMSKDGSLLGLVVPVSSDKIDPNIEGIE